MLRETKVGIAVSCSFLCLVGAVVSSKLRQQEPSTAQARARDDAARAEASSRPESKPASIRTGTPSPIPGLVRDHAEDLTRATFVGIPPSGTLGQNKPADHGTSSSPA